MQRLVALVPQPRLHLIRFHRVLAPNAKLRALVVPQGSADEQQPAWADTGECELEHAPARRGRISWARLLKRVFDIDMQHCLNCGGELKIIAAILKRLAPKHEPGRCWASNARDSLSRRSRRYSVICSGR